MANPRNLVVDAYNSLSADINKMPGRAQRDNLEGVVSERLDELSVDMSNEEILTMVHKFEKTWIESDVYAEWVKRGDENTNYWKGKHFQRPETDKTRAIVDNVIFEGVETAIPQFIGRNPEPDVELKRDEIGADGNPTNPIATVYVETLQDELIDLGDDLKVRAKTKKVARFWMLNLLGVAKFGWDGKREMPMMKVVRPKKIILDPDATIDEDGYTGDLVGEFRTLPAYKIVKFATEEGAEGVIKALVKDNMATKVQFIEVWSDTTLVWTVGNNVLMKRKNPHWNYDESDTDDMDSDFTPVGIAPEGTPVLPQLPEAGEAPDASAPGRPTMPVMNKNTSGLGSGGSTGGDTEPVSQSPIDQAIIPDQGDAVPEEDEESEDNEAPVAPMKKGVNHFPAPRKPYVFMVLFNLLDQPVDNTSLITQNLSNQDMINKRQKQIDKNADNMNNGLVVSLERSGLTAQQAKGVTEALRKGGVVGIPAGAPSDAIWRPETPGLPADIVNQLGDLRSRVKGIFGVHASTPQSLEPGQSVRGMVMNKTMDTDRMGGGIGEVIEQFADDSYNWFVQLKVVYEDKYQELAAQGGLPAVRVSIKEGSLMPKDKVTLADQAISLANEGRMAGIDLFKALDYSNAEELAVNAWLEKNAPDLLYKDDPRVQAAVQRASQAAIAMEQAKHPAEQPKTPSESIAYKDLPPDGKVQLAAKAGIILHPEGVAAHEQIPDQVPPATPPAGQGGP